MRETNALRKQQNRAILLLTLLTITALSGYSQFTNTVIYDFPEDVKHYSTEIATDGTGVPHEAVMGGTIYAASGINMAHFLNTGSNGGINNSIYFTHSDYDDIRVVDIVGDGAMSNATYYMVCLARPTSGTSNNDRILVIPVDKFGAVAGSGPWVIYSNTSTDGLYPLHAIYHSITNDLYICGYITDNNTNPPNEPDYTNYGDKNAFVIRCQTNGTVVNATTIETTYSNPANATEDYDIAMRLVELSANNNNNIFVTGSVNNVKWDAIGGTEIFHGGTMNVVFDTSLTPGTADYDHFGKGVFETLTGDEYGVGLVQDLGQNVNYVVGNYSFKGTGFQPNGGLFWVTALDGSFDHHLAPVNSRYAYGNWDHPWALQTLPAAGTPAAGYDIRFLIAGMENNEWCGTLFSWDDIRPFIYDVSLRFTTSISGSFHNWTTYRNQNGTGRKGVDPNSYYDLGGGISNIAWNPTFAARATTSDDVILSGPRWLDANGTDPDRLSLKRADATNLDDPTCTGSTSQTTPSSCGVTGFYTDIVEGLGYTSPGINTVSTTFTSFSPSSTGITLTTNSYGYASEINCTEPGGPYYKQGGPATLAATAKSGYAVYPNPATQHINIQLAAEVLTDDEITVRLVNIYGQVAAEIFSGSAKNLKEDHSLQLPESASGIYMVQILKQNKQVHQQKISIIQ